LSGLRQSLDGDRRRQTDEHHCCRQKSLSHLTLSHSQYSRSLY
jgi:hypothetical protein